MTFVLIYIYIYILDTLYSAHIWRDYTEDWQDACQKTINVVNVLKVMSHTSVKCHKWRLGQWHVISEASDMQTVRALSNHITSKLVLCDQWSIWHVVTDTCDENSPRPVLVSFPSSYDQNTSDMTTNPCGMSQARSLNSVTLLMGDQWALWLREAKVTKALKPMKNDCGSRDYRLKEN